MIPSLLNALVPLFPLPRRGRGQGEGVLLFIIPNAPAYRPIQAAMRTLPLHSMFPLRFVGQDPEGTTRALADGGAGDERQYLHESGTGFYPSSKTLSIPLFLAQIEVIFPTHSSLIPAWEAGTLDVGILEGGGPRYVESEARVRLAYPISACLLAVSCVKVNVQHWDQIDRPARTPDAVEVLLAQPDRPYTVIAVVESSFDGALKGFEDLRREVLEKAAELGGDAVILGPESKGSGVIFVPTPIFFDKKKLTGEVIAFRHPR
jgi:hypothetical protein